MNVLNNEKYNNGLFFLFEPLPKNANLLDNFGTLQYNGIRIPRIPLNEKNSLNLGQLIDIPQLNEKKNENETPKVIYL